MNKRIVLIIIIGIVVLASGAAALILLNPAQKESSPAYNDAWKLERIQGSWASDNEKYALNIDGYDFTVQIDGVYAMAASIQFDASEEFNEDNVRFTLQIDPASAIYPDVQGAACCEIDALWYEDGMICMRPAVSGGAENESVYFAKTAASQQTSWPFN